MLIPQSDFTSIKFEMSQIRRISLASIEQLEILESPIPHHVIKIFIKINVLFVCAIKIIALIRT